MKFTIWEKNTVHDVLELFKHENADQLEDLMALKESFDPKEKERELFNTSIGIREEEEAPDKDDSDSSKEDAEARWIQKHEKARKEVHKKTVEITLKKAQLLYLKEKVRDKNVRLPAIPYSIQLLQKIDNAIETLEQI